MREKKYLTVLDPLQEKFGDVMTGILLLGELFAELMWGASILIALGKRNILKSCINIIFLPLLSRYRKTCLGGLIPPLPCTTRLKISYLKILWSSPFIILLNQDER